MPTSREPGHRGRDCKFLLFKKLPTLEIKRPEKWRGDLLYENYDSLDNAFAKKELHPMGLKTAVAERIEEIIRPVREHFENNSKARELLVKVKSFEVTR